MDGPGGAQAPPPVASPYAGVGFESGLLVIDPKSITEEANKAIDTIPIPDMRDDIRSELCDRKCNRVLAGMIVSL